MTQHLLAISLGPVQDFISQSRRTRDLYASSELLSLISRWAFKALRANQAQLIYPPDHVAEESIANKLLAIVDDPAQVAERVRASVRQELMTLADANWNSYQDTLLAPTARDVYHEQVETFLEFYAAWIPYETGAFGQQRKSVESLLMARKGLRDFTQWKHQRPAETGYRGYKSSLDGARESVLRPYPKEEPLRNSDWHRFGIGPNEHLDAIGLLKRVYPAADRFVPIPTICLARWLDRISPDLVDLRDKLVREKVPIVRRPESPWLESFPYDAQIFFPDRWRPHLRDVLGYSPEQADHFGKEYLKPVLDKHRTDAPPSYLACLDADGDGIGRLLNQQTDIQHFSERSAQLAKFAAEARKIIAQHFGVPVYAGGDDVLAFLCLEGAVLCAQLLAQCFHACVPGATLSVGLGIGHFLEALGDLRQIGRRAEKLAKARRGDGLAIVLEKRAGGQSAEWFCNWADGPAERIRDDLAILGIKEDPAAPGLRLSMRKVHQVRRLLDRLDRVPEVLWSQALMVLSRSEAGQDGLKMTPEVLHGLGLEENPTHPHKTLAGFTDRLLIAAEIGKAGKGEGR